MDRFVKPRELTILGHPEYSLDGPVTLIAVSDPHAEFFNSTSGIWIGGNFSDKIHRTIRMQKVWKDLGLMHNSVEYMPRLQQEVYLRRESVVPGKHGMRFLMLALKEAEIKAESIPVHMHQGQTTTKELKDKGEVSTVKVNVGHINETKTLCIPTEEE